VTKIVRRFGAEGLSLWQRAAGGDTRPLRPVVPPQTFSAAMEFEDAIATLEPLLFILRRFLDRLALELTTSQHIAAKSNSRSASKTKRDTRAVPACPSPRRSGNSFSRLHTHFESLTTAASIIALDLRLIPTRPLVRQQGLSKPACAIHTVSPRRSRAFRARSDLIAWAPRSRRHHRLDTIKLAAPLAVIPPPAALPCIRWSERRCDASAHLACETRIHFGRPTYLWTETIRGEIAFQARHIRAMASGGNPTAMARSELDSCSRGGFTAANREQRLFSRGDIRLAALGRRPA